MKRAIRVERLLPYPPRDVWWSVASGEGLAAWLMPNDMQPELGRAFTFRMKPQRGWDGITYCKVIALAAGQEVAMSYRGTATGDKAVRCAGIDSEMAQRSARGFLAELDTVLRFTLVPDPACDGTERTRLILELSGFAGLKMVIVSLVMEMGWRRLLKQRLQAALAGAAQDRR